MKRLFRGWSWEHWYNLAREDIEEAFASVRRAARYALYAGLALWVFSGLHTVGPNEVGLESFCGRLLRNYEKPGLRYRFPWPVGSVRRVPMQTQQAVQVGFEGTRLSEAERLGQAAEDVLADTVAEEVTGVGEEQDSQLREAIRTGGEKMGYNMREEAGTGLPLLSGDHNLIRVFAVVQYVIRDPVRYIYATEGAELVLRRAASSALLDAVGSSSVDDVLTSERSTVQEAVRVAVQQVANLHRLGVDVASVQLQKVDAPSPVKPAFDAVSTAREERETRKNEAEQYRATEVPRSTAAAQRLVNGAEAFSAERVATARGDASRFDGVMREYRQTGRLTAERLRLETLEQVLSRANKVYVGGGNAPVNITIMDPDMPGAPVP